MWVLFWTWLARSIGWLVLLGGLGLGCAAKGSVCLSWNMALAEEVHDLHDVNGE
jgi:hypothetical protein